MHIYKINFDNAVACARASVALLNALRHQQHLPSRVCVCVYKWACVIECVWMCVTEGVRVCVCFLLWPCAFLYRLFQVKRPLFA